jgi:hypothetical protein
LNVSGEIPRATATLLPDPTTDAPVVTSFSMTDGAGDAIVPAVIIANRAIADGAGVTLNSDADLRADFVELIATSPFTSGAPYTVTFAATSKAGGAHASKSWSFAAE